jgi:thermostable 8-oxoguanine DNA glycosylase
MSQCETERMELLITLRGVRVPVASSILTLLFPEKYGVIDIRVWQVLHQYGLVVPNARGRNLTVRQWLEYLRIVRELADKCGTTPRIVDRSLFELHRSQQQGTLYRTASSRD